MRPAKRIFVNLPVSDLNRSIDFFTELGFNFDPNFNGDHASCMIIGDNIFAMLLLVESFQRFVPGKQVADSSRTAEVVVALSVDNRREVDQALEKAVSAGGTECHQVNDAGWMYGRAFQDPDGHVWEVFSVDPTRMPKSLNEHKGG